MTEVRCRRSEVSTKAVEKDMKKKLTSLALYAMLFALCFPAEAQQPTKVPRIGFLFAGAPSAVMGRIKAFRQGLRSVVMWKVKISSSSIAMGKES